jgi:ribosome-binding factor A
MKLRHERLSEMIRNTASETIIIHSQEFDHNFGIISVTDVVISPDEQYTDIYVHAQENITELARFLKPLSSKIEHTIGKDF